MKFSILIPVYNVEMFLFTCLNSILKQTCQDFEVILVNDGSSDNSGIICNSYAEKYSNFVVAHQNNQGLISARRKATKLAKGRYCIFCDSDDFLEETAIEEFSHIVDENNPDLILYNAYIYDGVNKIPFFDNVFEDRIVNNKESVYDLLLLTYKINAMWLKVCKREILDIERDYTDFYKCNYGEDLLQSIPIINNAQSIYYLNKALYNYRITSGMMKKYNLFLKIKSFIAIGRSNNNGFMFKLISELFNKENMHITVHHIQSMESSFTTAYLNMNE